MVVFLWQRNRDSNPNIQSQSLLCYRYTIPLSLFSLIIVAQRNRFVKGFLKNILLFLKLNLKNTYSSENKSSIFTLRIFAITKISLSVALRTCPSSFE